MASHGSSRSLEETHRKSSSLPAYARQGLSKLGFKQAFGSNNNENGTANQKAIRKEKEGGRSFGLFRRKKEEINQNESSSSSSESAEPTIIPGRRGEGFVSGEDRNRPSPPPADNSRKSKEKELLIIKGQLDRPSPPPTDVSRKCVENNKGRSDDSNYQNGVNNGRIARRDSYQRRRDSSVPCRRLDDDAQSTLSKKERREMLKARVEALRERLRDSSSDEESKKKKKANRLQKFYSDESLHRAANREGRSRAARTERFYKRRSRDEESIRRELESSGVEFSAQETPLQRSDRVDLHASVGSHHQSASSQSLPIPASMASRTWSTSNAYTTEKGDVVQSSSQTPSPQQQQQQQPQPQQLIHESSSQSSQLSASEALLVGVEPNHSLFPHCSAEQLNNHSPQSSSSSGPRYDYYPRRNLSLDRLPMTRREMSQERTFHSRPMTNSSDRPSRALARDPIPDRYTHVWTKVDYPANGKMDIPVQVDRYPKNSSAIVNGYSEKPAHPFGQSYLLNKTSQVEMKAAIFGGHTRAPTPPPRSPKIPSTNAEPSAAGHYLTSSPPRQSQRPASYSFESLYSNLPSYNAKPLDRTQSWGQSDSEPLEQLYGSNLPKTAAQTYSQSESLSNQSGYKPVPTQRAVSMSTVYSYTDQPPSSVRQIVTSRQPSPCVYTYTDQPPKLTAWTNNQEYGSDSNAASLHRGHGSNVHRSASDIHSAVNEEANPLHSPRNFNSVPKPWNPQVLQVKSNGPRSPPPKVAPAFKGDRWPPENAYLSDNVACRDYQPDTRLLRQGKHRPPPLNLKSDSSYISHNSALSPSPARTTMSGLSYATEPPKPESHHTHSNTFPLTQGKADSYNQKVSSPEIKANAPPPPPRRYSHQFSGFTVETLETAKMDLKPVDTQNNHNAQKSKSPSNLEDALLELEQIYQSLQMKEETSLNDLNDSDVPVPRPLVNGYPEIRSNKDSLDFENPEEYSNLQALSKLNVSGSYDSLLTDLHRRRYGLRRMSGTGPKLTDDLAYRRLQKPEPVKRNPTPTTSYLLLSPALSPATSTDDINKARSYGTSKEPDTVFDDMSFRTIRDANSQKTIDPQPPFGIPIGPIVPAASTDYLHTAESQAKPRPMFQPRFIPDVIQDDMAFRNLRKDKSEARPSSEYSSSEVNTEELDNILKAEEKPPASSQLRKKYRAVRSLSANISHLVKWNGSSALPPPDFERAQSLTNLSDILTSIVNGTDVTPTSEVSTVSSSSATITTTAVATTPATADSKTAKTQTPRTVKHRHEFKRQNKTQGAASESEIGKVSHLPWMRNNLYNLRLNDTSTSTETLTESKTNLALTASSENLNGSSTQLDSSTKKDDKPCDTWQVRVTVGTSNLDNKVPTNTIKQTVMASKPDSRATSEDEAVPSWKKGSLSLSSSNIATKGLDQHQVYRPLQNLRPVKPRPFFGSVGHGSVSDSDVRSKGKPIDETRLDELLRSLAQGAMTVTPSSLRRSLTELQKKQAGETKTDPVPPKPESSKSIPTIGTPTTTTSTTTSSIATLTTTITTTSTTNSPAVSAAAKTVIAAIMKAPDYEPIKTEALDAKVDLLSQPESDQDEGRRVVQTRVETVPSSVSLRYKTASAPTSQNSIRSLRSPEKGNAQSPNHGKVRGSQNGPESSSKNPSSLTMSDSYRTRAASSPTVLSSSKECKTPKLQSSKTASVSDQKESSDDASNKGTTEKKAERMAKYKEERRKQLASKYGDWSSSEDITSLGEEPSYMRFSRRYKKENKEKDLDNGTNEAFEKLVAETVSGSEKAQLNQNGFCDRNTNEGIKSSSIDKLNRSCSGRNTSMQEDQVSNRVPDPGGSEIFSGMVRTTRASRLRAKANMQDNGSPTSEISKSYSFRQKLTSAGDSENSPRSPLYRQNATVSSSSAAELNDHIVNKYTSQTPVSSDVPSSNAVDTPLHIGSESSESAELPRKIKDKSNKRKSNLNRAMIVEEVQQISDSTEDSSHRSRRSKRAEGPSTPTTNSERRAGTPSSEPLRSTEIVRSVQQKLAAWDLQATTDPSVRVSGSLDHSNDSSLSEQEEKDLPSKKPKGLALKRPEIPEVLRHRQAPASPTLSLNQLQRCTSVSEQGSNSVSVKSSERFNNLKHSENSHSGPSSHLSRSNSEKISIDLTGSNNRGSGIAKIDVRKSEKIKLHNGFPKTNDGLKLVEPSAFTVRIEVKNSECKSLEAPVPSNITQDNSRSRTSKSDVDSLTNAALNSDFLTSSDSEMGAKADKQCSVEVEGSKDLSSERGKHSPTRIVISSSPTQAISREALEKSVPASKTHGPNRIEMYHRDRHSPVKAITARNDISGSSDKSDSEAKVDTEIGNGGFKGSTTVYVKSEQIPKSQINSEREAKRTAASKPIQKTTKKEPVPDRLKRSEGNVHRQQSPDKRSSSEKSSKSSGSKTDSSPTREGQRKQNHDSPSKQKTDRVSERHQNGTVNHTEKSPKEIICSSKSNLSKRVEKEKSPEKGHSIKSDLRKEMPLKKSFPYHSKAANQFGSPKREFSQSPTSSKSPSSESSSVERKPLSPGEESEEQSEESRSSDSDLVTAPEDSPATNLEISSRGNDGATVIVIGDSSSKARSSDDSDVSFLPADENNLSWKTSELSSILKKRPSVDETQRQSKSPERHLLSRMSDSDQEYKSRSFEQYSILRKKSSSEESDDRSRGSETHSILKNRSIEERSLSPEPHSILKQRCSTEDLDLLSEPKPILKKKSSSEDLDFSDPKPILKKKSSTDDEEKPRPILKSRQRSGEDFDSGSDSSTSRRFRSLSRELENFDVDIRPILRSRMSLDEESSKPVSILKSSGSEDCSSKPQSILKSRSTTELEERVVPILKSRRDESEERAFSSILRTRSESEGEESSNSSTPVTTPVRPTSLLLPNEMEEKAESKSSLSSSASLSPLLPSILKKRAKEVHPLATPHTELAGILRAQRKLESPEDEEENRRITPIDIPDEGEDGPRISVAERIFQMETKLEDERNRSCQSPWRSGQSTPRGFRSTAGSTPPFRSGECTPRLDEKIAQLMQCYKPISDEQLLSRLEDVAQSSRQKRRNRTGDRYRTQPVTSDELEETDSLASVQSFRRMVLTRASLDAFKQREKELSPRSPTDKKTEFPQPFRPEHRKDRNKLRYRTLPITQEELNEAERMSSARAAASQGKTSEPGSSTATQDEDEDKGSDDEILHMSVAAKASLFMHMQAQKAAPQTSTVRRYINRRGLQRSQTQPITVEELHEASKVADEDSNGSSSGTQSEPKPIKKQNSVSNINDLSTMSETEKKNKSSSESDDDFTKMSLAERVKFFNLKVLEDKLPSQKPPLSGAPMRKRRFKTQPVTTEEVEKAQALKVSPLAASLAKPPEPEILGTLPIQAARDLMYKHGEEMLTKTSSNRQSSAATSTTTQEQTKEPSGNSVGLVIKSSSIKKSTEAKDEQKIQSCSQSSTTIVNCVTETTSDTTKKAVSTHQQDIQCKSSITKTVESESKTIKVSSSEMQVETSETSVKSTTVGVYSSNDDDSSSTSSGREVKRIKNEAVNRRRNAALRKMEERRSCCDLVGTETAASSARMQAMLHAHHQRSNTEPLTKLEKEEAKEAEEIRGGTVAERLAALQKSGEEEWRKRVPLFKDNDIPVLKTKEKESTPESKVRERRRSRDERPSSIVDRINLLETAQQSWKQRVEEKDTSKFTVAGKMGRSPKVSQESPLTDRQKRTPKAAIFRSKTADLRELQQKADISTPVKIGSPLVHRSISMPNNDIDSLASLTDSEEENNSPIKVAIPKADDETFQAFFESVNSEKLSSQKVEINEDVFEQIVSESRQMLKIQKRTVKKQGRKIGSRNPLKTLAERSDIQNEYTEVKSGFAEKEFKRIKVEQFAKNSDLAISALAGLASKEDFTAIALKKSTIAINSPLLPYKDLMLIQVKGRRHVQSRLVEPSVKSINKGDNYILVTPSEVYCWIGEFSNVIERSRAAEISTMIQTKRDLGCKSSSEVITIDEEKKTARNQAKNFFKLLGGEEQSKEAANPEEDELYESAIIDTNMIYKVEGDELVPYEEYWGNIPKYEMLNSKQVLVFDFGSEMYVWQGKQAPFELRKKAIRLAKELWEQGYDYSACDISPIHNLLNDSSVPKEGKQRPSWALFAKMNQHMETVLFREKFLDWPDMSRVIKVKRQESDEKVDTTSELTPCDAKEMLEQELKEPDLILEGSHVGRGISFWDEAENRNYEITTLGIKVWHILEYDRTMLPRESWGQFHSGDTYVIRWQFMVTVAGRDLSGQISRHSFVGRERCAYFFWQGKDSTINEKGASALMTVELDEERGPHVRVSQGSEPPSFLNLFDGTMIIHNGKREVENDETEETDKTKSSWRMFMVRGEFENEAFLVEIKRSKGALRSRGSYILTNTETGLVFVWHGVKTQTHTREIANFTAENLKQSRPMELGVSNGTQLEIKVIQEGKETKEFLAGLGDDKQSYHSLVKSSLTFDYTPRLYYLSSVSGIFMATEILCPFRSIKLVCSFPFLQSELYKTQQPALFLLDNHHEVFLWQGWWPEADDDNDNTATGSAKIRWNVDRRCAMQTAMLYCKAKNPDSPPTAYLVSAGLEPLAFTNLFPEWELHEEITAQNLKEGKNIGEQLLVEEVLSHLTRTRYSLDELQDDPLPEGVDPSRLESYLADDEFQDVLKMTKEEFYNLPEWKQTNLKKMAELF